MESVPVFFSKTEDRYNVLFKEKKSIVVRTINRNPKLVKLEFCAIKISYNKLILKIFNFSVLPVNIFKNEKIFYVRF